MNRPTFTIQVPGYQPVTVTLEPSAALTPPTAPPGDADAAGASGGGKMGKRGGMTNAEKCRAYRARQAGVAPVSRGVANGVGTVSRDTADTVGGVGGVLSSETPILEIRSEMQQTPKNRLSLRDTATPTPTPRDTISTPVAIADIIKAFPPNAGTPPSTKQVSLAVRAVCMMQACSQDQALEFVYRRVKSYAAGSRVKTTQAQFRPSWSKWVESDAFGPEMPAWWFERNAKAAPESANEQVNREMGGGFQPGRRRVI